MAYYNVDPYHNTLLWTDVFDSPEEFIEKVGDVGGITDTAQLTELYNILSLKYLFSHTRYSTEGPFILGIKRELYTEFPFYLERQKLAQEMRDVEIAEVQLAQNQLRNLINTNDTDVVDADTVAIDDLSTQQENVRVTNNRLQAIREKYNNMNKDYLRAIYNRCDGLFRVVLSRDDVYLYPED